MSAIPIRLGLCYSLHLVGRLSLAANAGAFLSRFIDNSLTNPCCLAPLSNSFTARSLGKGKIGLDGGMLALVRQEDSVVLPAFAVAIGLSSDFDLGVQIESASIGVLGKCSFIDNKERGFSLAGVLGAGAVASGSYAYAGPVLS